MPPPIPDDEPPPKPKKSLPRAAEASDAGVHRLLAERQTAAMNGDADAVASIDEAIEASGFAPPA